MEKKIGVITGLVGIFGTGFTVYSHFSGQEPDQQMTNLLIEERLRHKELIGVLREIAEEKEPIKLVKSNEPKSSLEEPPCGENGSCGPEINQQQIPLVAECAVENANARIIVPALNVRSGPANFSYLASWVGAVKKGDPVRITDRKSSGPLGLGTDWIKIDYCNDTNKSGWISTKLEGGAPTIETISHKK
ncbi:MAG: SH3 domain-containing protein [Candidatus Thiodiazotropha lotti]